MNLSDSITITGVKTSLTLSNRVFLAPMAGVSDLPFRLLCHEQGAGLVCMEMVSAKAITYHNRGTEKLLETTPGEHPVSLQLFTHEPEVLAGALDLIEEKAEFDLLDINMGCPVPKIVNNGEGSALMKDPKLIEELVRAAVDHTRRPVTVKMRIGFDEEHRNAVDCARAAEAGGASAVAVHGRTRPQMYSGKADLRAIAEVKRALAIPVFGNGDIKDHESAVTMMNETGCDAVLVGRAAEGNPWIFRKILDPAFTGPTPEERKAMILRHADLMLEHKDPVIAMREMRKHVAWYVQGTPGAAKLRSQVMQITTREELAELLDSTLERQQEGTGTLRA